MTSGEINPRYGNASATVPTWDQVERLLTHAQLYWLVTVRTDGRPHVTPLVGVWHDGTFAFCTGEDEQKARNLDSHQQVAVTAGPAAAQGWADGEGAVVEGTATRVTDPDDLRRLADAWTEKYGDDWRWEVRGTKFFELSQSGDGTGGGAAVFRVPPSKVLLFGGDHGQTAYRF